MPDGETYQNVFVMYGASEKMISLFKRLEENSTLWPSNTISVYESLNNNLIEIDTHTYNRFTLHKQVSFPSEDYLETRHQRFLEDLDKGNYDLLRRTMLLEAIEAFSDTPSEVTSYALYKALKAERIFSADFYLVLYEHKHFFDDLKRSQFDRSTLCQFLNFLSFKSNDTHVIENAFTLLWICAESLPFELLNVFGRYALFKYISYEMIDRVRGISDEKREKLIFTHLKSIGQECHSEHINWIIERGDDTAKYWAALNTISDFSAEYFCKHITNEPPNLDRVFAALSHYIFCLKRLLNAQENELPLEEPCAKLHQYLFNNFKNIRLTEDNINELSNLFINFKNDISQTNNNERTQRFVKQGLKLLDMISACVADPVYDDFVKEKAPDLIDQARGYSSLIRPQEHRYNLFIEAKIHAADRWFPREFVRIKSGDYRNWGTLTLTMQDGEKFNQLSAWILGEIKKSQLPRRAISVSGADIDVIIRETLTHCPDDAELYLHSEALFVLALTCDREELIRAALWALKRQSRNGMVLSGELKQVLESLDTSKISRNNRILIKTILGTKLSEVIKKW